MSAVLRSTTRGRQPYVHKLRLEARDGAGVEIQPAAPLTDVGSRILRKLIIVALVFAMLLVLGGEALL